MSGAGLCEAVTLTQRRTSDAEAGLEIDRRIRGEEYPSAIDVLHSSETFFDRAVTIQEEYAEHRLTFTDAMTVAHVEHHDIDSVLSFDDDFDGIVSRLVPSTLSSGE